MNVAAVRGRLVRPVEVRTLASGVELATYELRVEALDGHAESLAAVWADPPAGGLTIAEGTDVVVVGRVRRRFFRVGESTASRTELAADIIVPARQRKAVGRALAEVVAAVAG